MRTVIIAPFYSAERKRRELGIGPGDPDYVWISPTARDQMDKLRGRWQESLVVYRPTGETACPDVEEFLAQESVRVVEKR